jgi:hypothetical protein
MTLAIVDTLLHDKLMDALILTTGEQEPGNVIGFRDKYKRFGTSTC